MEPSIDLSHKEFLKIDRDYEKAAKVADLVYVSDQDEGIRRVKKGSGFAYYFKEKIITDETLIQRIRKLAIPPAWTNVWICSKETGHLQATGIDARGRKQYRYHKLWESLRNETKFHRLYEFGKYLPLLRERVKQDLAQKELTEEKVVATILSVMQKTYIRIGSDDYEKLYGSYGLTTLKDRHVKVNGDTVQFCFTGKKGIEQNITLKHRKIARMVKQCRDIPGKELFQYYDEAGNRKPIDSGMVNRYIKEATGGDFTAKDFRTWAGTLHVLRAFCSFTSPECDADCKKNVLSALDNVSKKLGNTRTVCRKYYVHPGVITLYEERALDKYLKELDHVEDEDHKTELTSDEKVLMKLLKDLV